MANLSTLGAQKALTIRMRVRQKQLENTLLDALKIASNPSLDDENHTHTSLLDAQAHLVVGLSAQLHY